MKSGDQGLFATPTILPLGEPILPVYSDSPLAQQDQGIDG